MESTSARDLDRRLAELVRSERHLAVQFVVELAAFATRELYRELGYTSLFYYCVRQLGLSKSSAFRRSEAARLTARFPAIAGRLAEGRLSIRALVELREVLTDDNHLALLARAEGKSQEEAQLLAVEIKPRPIPRDIVRAVPGTAARTAPPPAPSDPCAVVPAGTNSSAAAPAPSDPRAVVPAGTNSPAGRPEVVQALTPALRRLNVTVSAEFIAELEQVRAALSHTCPDGGFEQVVREAFRLVLERDRKRKALTDRPRAQRPPQPRHHLVPPQPAHYPQPPQSAHHLPPPPRAPGRSDRYVPAAVKRAVWQRDRGRCTWPMGDGQVCGATHRLELDHELEVALGGRSTLGNIRLLCKSHNLLRAEQRFGRAFMAQITKSRPGERHTT